LIENGVSSPPGFNTPLCNNKFVPNLLDFIVTNKIGILKADDRLLPSHDSLQVFKDLLREEWNEAKELVDQARNQAEKRK